MMLPTHALAGMVLALPLLVVAPEFAGVALLAGFLGGVLPDLDMYVGHRKTLHYPVYFPLLSVPALLLALVFPSPVTVAGAFVLLGAALHCLSDVGGGGLELRPWEATSDRGVYDHHRGRWIAPRRWVAFDGSPGDLALSIGLATPLLVALDGPFVPLVVFTLLVAVVYAGVRRALPGIAESLLDAVLPDLPRRVRTALPARYLEGTPRTNVTTDEPP